MARILSAAMTKEYAQIGSTHPITMLAELLIPGGPVPYRAANWPEDIVFHGLTFVKFAFDVDSLEDATSMALVQLRLTMHNVDQQLQALLENYWNPESLWEVTLWQIDVNQPNETFMSEGSLYTVAQVATTWTTAVADLVAEGLTLTTTLPRRRYTALSGFELIPRRVGF
jgi:hypothetical protein